MQQNSESLRARLARIFGRLFHRNLPDPSCAKVSDARPQESRAQATALVRHVEEEERTQTEPVHVPSLLPTRNAAKKASLANFGIDFGTSWTKVFFKDVLSGHVCAWSFEPQLEGLPPFCWPSTIRAVDGKLFFGTFGERTTGGRVIRSFKVCLVCEKGFINGSKCSFCQCETTGFPPGSFNLRITADKAVIFDPIELVTLYLADLLHELLDRASSVGFVDVDSKPTFNMAAPLDMLNDPSREAIFNRVLHMSDMMKEDVYQGMSIERAKRVVSEVCAGTPSIPGEEERHTFLVPETHAATMGYITDGKAEPGLYAAIDIGAGTTDIAVFRHCREYCERDFAYYSAGTELVGGDGMDRSVLAQLAGIDDMTVEERTEVLGQIRSAKQRLDDMDRIPITGGCLTSDIFMNASQTVLDRILRHYRRIWGLGFEKERNPASWKNLNLFLLGGCNRLRPIRERMEYYNPAEDFCDIQPIFHRIALPAGMESLDPCVKAHLAEYSDLLMIAYGLSFHIGEIRRFFKPREVEPMERRRPKESGLVPEGHWW